MYHMVHHATTNGKAMTHDIHELGRLSEDPTWTGARQVLSELRPELTDVALADVPDPRVGVPVRWGSG